VSSKASRRSFAGGMTKFVRKKEKSARNKAEMKYGTSIRLKLTPLLRIATISVLDAIFDVKKMTAIKQKRALNRFTKYGMKFK
jgi:hypothetical protein